MGMNLRKNGRGYGGGKSVSKTNQRIIIYNNTMDIRFLELARSFVARSEHESNM